MSARKRRRPPHVPPPYGLHDLVTSVEHDPGPPPRVRCYVLGCEHWVRPPAKGFKGEPCPDHGVFCHHSSGGVTLSYRDPRRNLLTDQALFMRRVRGNPHKVESHRFGLLNSEDACSWGIFRSLQNAGLLHVLAGAITGTTPTKEPLLWLWGLSSHDDRFEPWPLLHQARLRFEIDKLPVNRPLSEMDIALHVPGELLLVIEAKVLAPNPSAAWGAPRATPQSLTAEEVLHLYDGPEIRLIDRERVQAAGRLHTQLYRYLILADFMSSCDGPGTKPFLANLVRHGHEHDAAHAMFETLKPEFKDRFARITWEQIYHLTAPYWPLVSDLRQYMLSKPVGTRHGFVPAFHCDTW